MVAIDEAGSANPDLKVLLAAVEASGEAVVVTSADLEGTGPRIEYVNSAFTRMTGYEAHEILGRTPRLLQGQAPSVPCSTGCTRRWRPARPSRPKR